MKPRFDSPFLKRRARVELTPLLDVIFLVLVFFIYAVFDMALHRGLKVDLPAAAGVPEKGERVIITLDAQNTFQLNGRPLPADALVAEVKRLVAVRRETPVLISGDRRASLGTGIEMLARLKESGVKEVSFQVKGQTGGEIP